MAQVFISYGSGDEKYAVGVYRFLRESGYSAWFAPFNIQPGQNFAQEIARELNWSEQEGDDNVEQRVSQCTEAQAVVLILSEKSMRSKWVKREIKLAINNDKQIIPLQIDHNKLTAEFSFMLVDVQILPAYHLSKAELEKFGNYLSRFVEPQTDGERASLCKRIPYRELGIGSIAVGDPYYTCEETLKIYLTKQEFYLAPPEFSEGDVNKEWAESHFALSDSVFGTTLSSICGELPIEGLSERIEASRKKIFLQFLNSENGCYYNNKKYGIYNIRPYGRTEDLSEMPEMRIDLFTTDYFTHRVMKDVCKGLIAEGHPFFNRLTFSHLGAERIFYTSLGINLLLTDSDYREEGSVILTSRSTNAAETYRKRQYSVSIIEGVSLSDYDSYLRTVNIKSAVLRGLQEELGVKECDVKADSLRFYELFINLSNLEMGFSCSAELVHTVSAETVLQYHGKDEEIEVAEKRLIPKHDLLTFALTNRAAFLPQAFYTILSYYESIGVSLIDRNCSVSTVEQEFISNGEDSPCGVALFRSENFYAVIEGEPINSGRLWKGMRGDEYVASVLCDAVGRLPADATAKDAISFLNDSVRKAYEENGVAYADLPAAERLQASAILYSVKRQEVWSFGSCKLRIGATNFDHTKKVDALYDELVTLCLEAALATGKSLEGEEEYLKESLASCPDMRTALMNSDYSFGYELIDGGKINLSRVRLYAIQRGDHVVFASNSYPELFDTVEECEGYFKEETNEGTCKKVANKGNYKGEENKSNYKEILYRLRCATRGATHSARAFLSFLVK